MVSAWACHNRLVLGQQATEAKSNEITAIPKLLALLELKGCIVTLDAMGCQSAIAQQILEQKGDYVLGLKGNQGTLHEAVEDFFTCAERQQFAGVLHDHLEEIDKDHGRFEIRRYWITEELQSLPETGHWKGLRSIVLVESEVVCLKDNTTSRHTRYYISSLAQSAAEFQRDIRLHWSIENQCHWVLDTVFREDHNQTCKRHAAKNLSALRRIVLNLLKLDDSLGKISLPKKRLHALMDQRYREKVLSLA